MGTSDALSDEAEARRRIGAVCFKIGPPGSGGPQITENPQHTQNAQHAQDPARRRLGVELEWFVRDADAPGRHVPASVVQQVFATALGGAPRLPSGGALTVEPGGQLELSTAPASSLTQCLRDAHDDMGVVRRALADRGFVLGGGGLDCARPPSRSLHSPRYDAMERFFDGACGRWGRLMMCTSASVQVCVDIGATPEESARRWHHAHRLGPVLVAMFANSPLLDGRASGWRSTRQLVWHGVGSGRTHAPAATARGAQEFWADYVLAAPVMFVRGDDTRWDVPMPPMTFGAWVAGGRDGLRPPTHADLDLHLSTLFPPVRPRGTHLELRMIDQQDGDDGWVVPTVVVAALIDDAKASRTASAVLDGLYGGSGDVDPVWWRTAAHDGLSDARLRAAAREIVNAALGAVDAGRLDCPDDAARAAHRFADRFTLRGRCPADDVREAAERPLSVGAVGAGATRTARKGPATP